MWGIKQQCPELPRVVSALPARPHRQNVHRIPRVGKRLELRGKKRLAVAERKRGCEIEQIHRPPASPARDIY